MNSKIAISIVLLLLCIGIIFWFVSRPPPEMPRVPDPPELPVEIIPQKSAAELRAERDAFFTADVDPHIIEADKLNREAADRCVARLKESFDSYRTGIAPFCSEINTWGTRLGVMRRMPTDWWYQETDVSEFIQEKFARHLFTDRKLAQDIEDALQQFREDVVANQNAMVTQVRAAITTRDLPDLPEIEYGDFAKDMATRLKAYSTESAEWSVVNGIVIEVASGAGGFVGEYLLAQLVIKLSSMAAATSTAVGGATAGGAAVGGGTGTLGGPIGAAAGIAVGVVIGGIIDWWMSNRFEAQMAEKLNGMIDELTGTVIAGDADNPGLREGLLGSCELMQRAYQSSLRASIVGGVES